MPLSVSLFLVHNIRYLTSLGPTKSPASEGTKTGKECSCRTVDLPSIADLKASLGAFVKE